MKMPRALSVLLILVMLAVRADAQDEPAPNEKEKAFVREASVYLQGMQMRLASDDAPVERIERHLHTFGDSSRSHIDGSLWAWGKKGRPKAFLELWRQSPDSPWGNAVTLTSLDLVSLKLKDETTWKPNRLQIDPQVIPDAPIPHAKDTVRLEQMKEQASRFSAHEFWNPNNTRFDLRVFVRPVLRYAEHEARIHDGAVFIVAHVDKGMNPEILLLIEAIGESPEQTRWHYSAARSGSAEMHLELDDKEVWKQDRATSTFGVTNDPYCIFLSQR